jgi:hypothetical protein
MKVILILLCLASSAWATMPSGTVVRAVGVDTNGVLVGSSTNFAALNGIATTGQTAHGEAAYAWGDHSTNSYLKPDATQTLATAVSQAGTAYGWGDHGTNNYLTPVATQGLATVVYLGDEIAAISNLATAAQSTANEATNWIGTNINSVVVLPSGSATGLWFMAGMNYDGTNLYHSGLGEMSATATGMPDVVTGRSYTVSFYVTNCDVAASASVTFGGGTQAVTDGDIGSTLTFKVFATATTKFTATASAAFVISGMTVSLAPELYMPGQIKTRALILTDLPTASAGLVHGAVWNSNGFLMVQP